MIVFLLMLIEISIREFGTAEIKFCLKLYFSRSHEIHTIDRVDPLRKTQ